MAIQVNRRGSDSVEIFADDRSYYNVSYIPETGKWMVRRYFRGVIAVGEEIGEYASAEEAVGYVKAMLSEKESELTDALESLL